MKFFKRVALAALIIVPVMGVAEEERQDVGSSTDEIVVVGRSVSTSTSRVEVEREILVDTAVVLKEIPGANVNSNGAITGIAQYRGMYGDSDRRAQRHGYAVILHVADDDGRACRCTRYRQCIACTRDYRRTHQRQDVAGVIRCK